MDQVVVTRPAIEHAMNLAPEMAWFLDPVVARAALQSPRLNAKAAAILTRRLFG